MYNFKVGKVYKSPCVTGSDETPKETFELYTNNEYSSFIITTIMYWYWTIGCVTLIRFNK